MVIYFVRHASAGQSKTNPTQDARRPLDKEGIEQATMMGRVLASDGVQVDEVISSPLKRATQTAVLVANEIGFDGKIIYSPILSKESDFEQFRLLIKKHTDRDAIMLVGHNPSLSQYLSLLLSAGATDRATELKKGAVARVELDGRGRAVLHWCLTPRLVRSIYESVATSSRPKTSRK
jgi:phosphohistidine phosphatase